ncbi:hypothetical protein NE237_024973 [Protea cynaroides]|uniref:PROP1-like PPR domain-containing protein n=1 Tax=Protea cynaroides TaxID=273540 RepID=A0A9Q0H121_9MAGN|nr:hypothetical protein NE237_024973 [Protea cynaroides]
MATKLLSPWQSGIFSRISGVSSRPSPVIFIRGLCSEETNSVSEIPPVESQSPSIESDTAPNVNVKEENAVGGVEESIPQRTPRCKYPPKPEKLEDTICRMMANREWTTRLQRSIRALVPEFDHSLVWNVLHGARNSEHALQFFRWVVKTGYQHDRSTHLKMIQILGRTQKLNHARCILFDMPKKGIEWDEEFFIVLISGYGQAGIVQESVKMFRKMKELGVKRTVKSYDALFKVIMRRGRYLMGKRIFNEMLREGVMPIRHTYNILLWGFFLSLKVETANRFFKDMKDRGISPDVVTYNTMIYGYIRVKMMEEAEKLFVEMKAKNLNPTVVSYTSMIKGYVSMGRIDDGLRVFDEMGSFGIKPNHSTYLTLLPGLCDAEKMSEAHKLVEEMVETHQAPEDNSIFLRLISCQCKAGKLDWAADVLKGMIQLNIPVEAAHYGVLIENFCKAGAYQRAIKLLDKVIEKEIILNSSSLSEMEPNAYNPIIEYLCNNGRTVKAEVFLRHLMKKGVQDRVAFNNLIRGHSKDGTPDTALEILKIMSRRGVPSDADAYKLLVESFLRKGGPADAKIALDGMIESGHLPDPLLFSLVMQSLFDDGRVQTSSRVMKSMVEKGVMENTELVAKILEALLMRGHVEEALGRIDLLMNNGHVPNFDNLLVALCEKDKTISALKLLDFGLERDCNISFSSYDKVLDALLAAGKTLNAYSILCKIMEKGGITDRHSCEDLIRSLNAEGNTKQADILSRMLTGGESIRSGKKGKKVAASIH